MFSICYFSEDLKSGKILKYTSQHQQNTKDVSVLDFNLEFSLAKRTCTGCVWEELVSV